MQVSSDETERLIKMEETLHQRVIGQEEAVVAISRAIRRARVGLKNPNRPIASFIFSGPTGVGKSELAKTLATYYFGSQDAMVRLDMSEFMERHTVSKLIGSPPGKIALPLLCDLFMQSTSQQDFYILLLTVCYCIPRAHLLSKSEDTRIR